MSLSSAAPGKKTTPPKNSNTKDKSASTRQSKQSAPKEQSDFWCVKCSKHFLKQQNNFVSSQSPLYENNNCFLPICKSCMAELYVQYRSQLHNEYDAVRRLCMKFDMYYNTSILNSVLELVSDGSVINRYAGRISLPQYKGKSYDDTIDEELYDEVSNNPLVREVEEENVERLVERGIKDWGSNFSPEEYIFLNNQFSDWVTRCVVTGKSRETLVRELCIIKLQQSKALLAKNVDLYNKLTSTFQKTLQSAELTPKQESDINKAAEKPLGVMIKMFEDERPIPEPLDEWKDVDGIMKLILVYFIGHLCKMLGLKNRYAKMYEDEMDTYRVDIPDLQDADSEDIFEYLLDNGFENTPRSEGDEEVELSGE